VAAIAASAEATSSLHRAAWRYGWIGGTGTTAHVAPSTGTIGILLPEVQMTGPTSTPFMREFWQYAFGAS
jgi:hypothetical protein